MNTADLDFVHAIDLGDFEVGWAGPDPRGWEGFCFGSDDGRLLLTDVDGRHLAEPEVVVASREAVNGVAHHGNHFAVSTRADVSLESREAGRISLHVGAHGLMVTPGGVFVASAGRLGWLLIEPEGMTRRDPPRATVMEWPGSYIYQSVAMRDRDGRDVIASAMLGEGIGATRLTGSADTLALHALKFPSFDAIDVCPIGRSPGSLAVAVAGQDGTIILSRDVLADKQPQTRMLSTGGATVYRVMCCRGHLVVLTSRALHILLDVVTDFLSAALSPPTGRGLVLPVVAVDANVYDDQYVLVVRDDNVVLRVDIQAIADGAAAGHLGGPVALFATQVISPRWDEREVESTARALAAV